MSPELEPQLSTKAELSVQDVPTSEHRTPEWLTVIAAVQGIKTQKLVQLFWAVCMLHAQTKVQREDGLPLIEVRNNTSPSQHIGPHFQSMHSTESTYLPGLLLAAVAHVLGKRSRRRDTTLRGKDACQVIEACSVADLNHDVVVCMLKNLGRCRIVGDREQASNGNVLDLRTAIRTLDHLAKVSKGLELEAQAHKPLRFFIHKITACMHHWPGVLTGWDFRNCTRALRSFSCTQPDAQHWFLLALHSAAFETHEGGSLTCRGNVWGPESGLEQLFNMMQYQEVADISPSSHLVTHALLDHAHFWSGKWNEDQLACAATAALSMTDHIPKHLHTVLVKSLSWQVGRGDSHGAELLARLVLSQPYAAAPLTEAASMALTRSVSALHPCTALNLAAWCKLTSWSHGDAVHVQDHMQRLLQALGMRLSGPHDDGRNHHRHVDAEAYQPNNSDNKVALPGSAYVW